MWHLWRVIDWATTVTVSDRKMNSYIRKTLASIWSDQDQDKAESWLIGVFGTPWAATGSLLRQFESSSMSAERKQDCWSTNQQQTNKQTASMTTWQSSADAQPAAQVRIILHSKKWFSVEKEWHLDISWYHEQMSGKTMGRNNHITSDAATCRLYFLQKWTSWAQWAAATETVHVRLQHAQSSPLWR